MLCIFIQKKKTKKKTKVEQQLNWNCWTLERFPLQESQEHRTLDWDLTHTHILVFCSNVVSDLDIGLWSVDRTQVPVKSCCGGNQFSGLMCLRVKKRKNTHLWLLLSLPLLCVTFKSSINLTLLPECQRSDPHFLPFRQWEQDRAWKASSCTTYFLLYYRSPGNVGTALPPGYLFTFSLQDYIGIIIVFCGVFFSCLALFKGPLDPERWRKMAPFWGIWLLRKKIQRHTGSFISVFCLFFFPSSSTSLLSFRC